jgi:hypothetical protein
LLSLLRLLRSGIGTKRAGAYVTDVGSWWKLTYERSGDIRVLTHQRSDDGSKSRSAAGLVLACYPLQRLPHR